MAHEMATGLVTEHGLGGWLVGFDRALRRAGMCRYDTRSISLSRPLTLLHDEAEVRDTVLHEIAHALAGPRAGHGPEWRSVAARIGCSGTRCVPADAPRVPGAWVGTCGAGHTTERHRRPERVASCTRCAPRFDVAHVFEWTHHGRTVAMHPNYVAELAALRRGHRVELLAPGAPMRITAPGEQHGLVGTVVRRSRTRYTVHLPGGLYSVPFGCVEPA